MFSRRSIADMDISKYQHSESIDINATPNKVYDLVADITGYGRFSPVCTGGSWDNDERTWFTGTNAAGEMKWETKCRVDVATPSSEFSFTNMGLGGENGLVEWSYKIESRDGGCTLSETWNVLPGYFDFMSQFVPDVAAHLDSTFAGTCESMKATLKAVKAEAESA